MFPLFHYFVNKKIYQERTSFLVLGGLWPDLASAACPNEKGRGLEIRNLSHASGDEFYHWCSEHAPEAKDLARGIISHGIEPQCVDHYADEAWPGAERGWCFMEGIPYIERVAEATQLPKGYRWWKTHNFVEMACELLVQEEDPDLGSEIMAALQDTEAIRAAAALLAEYYQLDAERIRLLYENAADIYAIQPANSRELAERQKRSFAFKPGIKDSTADVDAMAALIETMAEELRPKYRGFLDYLFAQIRPVLLQY